MRQIAAEELGIPIDQVRVVVGDTDNAIYDDGPRASRVTYTEGQAVVAACGELQARLKEAAAEILDCDQDGLEYEQGVFRSAERRINLGEVVRATGDGDPITVSTELMLDQRHDIMYFAAQVADVTVDPETGEVELRRLVTAHDVGTIINPMGHQGQIDGGIVTGIGLALTEELILQDGRIANAHLGEYKLPTIADIPTLETVLVPSGGGTGPYDAKAIGELANNAPPAAIANAVADAVGARVFELPVTAERVLAAQEAD
jgi:CO/xanthine dehydrogenase Mo-binding subunit